MDDIVKPVVQWISDNIPWTILIVIFVVSLFFEISKVKVYPLKWLWKAISWPFRKIDEQRTNSFKNIVIGFKSDMDEKLNEMAQSSNANCAAVKACFVDLEKRFDKLDAKQQETEERLDMLAAARIKNHVLNFARQCRKGEKHSREDFANLMKEHQIYEDLVSKYQAMDAEHRRTWENNVYKHDYAYILRVYDLCNDNNDFLE